MHQKTKYIIFNICDFQQQKKKQEKRDKITIKPIKLEVKNTMFPR